MKKLNWKTTTFDVGYEDFMIDIVESDNKWDEPMYETWLYREKTGTKIYVVGELKKNYPHLNITQYARHMIDYIGIVWDSGYDFYAIYDEHIEDVENACYERMKAERNV